MAKMKLKKVMGLSDKLHAKKSKEKTKKQLNPFEIHINKEKFKVLGKKSKCDRGLPGISRAKALKKRKNTLGYELKLVNKSNAFIDKRIGEKNISLTEEEKIMARFTAEKIQQHKTRAGKQSIYNLADDEILTHRGQTLEEIEKYDDPRSDDEEEDLGLQKFGRLENNFVSDANFGGGVLTRSENHDGAKSRKDLIEQLIAESKKRKMEKQKLKEETLDLTEKLDTEWKDLQPVVSKNLNKELPKADDKQVSLIDKLLSAHEKKNEDYDKTMRELKFEPRGTPSDRLKSEDEIAKIEKDKLEKLERDRLARMHGIADIEKSDPISKHRSADDLDVGYIVDSKPELEIAYDTQGNLLMPLDENTTKKNKQQKSIIDDDKNGDDNENDSDNDNDDEDESSGDDDNNSDDESVDSLDDLRENEKSSSEDESEKVELENITKVTNVKLDKSFSEQNNKNTKKSVSFAANEKDITTVSEKREIKSILKNRKRKLSGEYVPCDDNNKKPDIQIIQENPEKIKENLKFRKEMMEKASKEVPFTFEMPKSYESFAELLDKQPPEYQYIIVERIIKCNHPSLAEGNKRKLGILFAYLLQYLNDLFTDNNLVDGKKITDCFKCFDSLISHYYLLAQMDPENSKICILEVIKEKYEDFKKQPKRMPPMDTIIFFKLVSILYSTSDLKHPVVTPCFHFISQILMNVKVRSSISLSRGIFLIIIILEYTSLSKRFLPAAINYIRGVFVLFLPPLLRNDIKVIPPFKNNQMLFNLTPISLFDESVPKIMQANYLVQEDTSDEFRLRVLNVILQLFDSFYKLTTNLNSHKYLFEPILNIINKIPLSDYPNCISDLVNKVNTSVHETSERIELKYLMDENKPKQIRLYEPAIDNDFSGRKKRVMSKEKLEYQKLVYKHKKEMKGALREIRRDKSYISNFKVKERIKRDNVRKEKVKRIYSDASLQQGELNALQRSKKKKK